MEEVTSGQWQVASKKEGISDWKKRPVASGQWQARKKEGIGDRR